MASAPGEFIHYSGAELSNANRLHDILDGRGALVTPTGQREHRARRISFDIDIVDTSKMHLAERSWDDGYAEPRGYQRDDTDDLRHFLVQLRLKARMFTGCKNGLINGRTEVTMK